MAYTSENYANTYNQIYILNYTGNVKYYYYDQNNNQIDAFFQCQNASFWINYLGEISWKNGTWINGYWRNGTFDSQQLNEDGLTWEYSENKSIWIDGYWHTGTFSNGYWLNGIFNSGDFQNSTFYNGVFGYSNISDNVSIESQFYNSIFQSGLFAGTTWTDNSKYITGDNSYWYSAYKNDDEQIWNGGYIDDIYSSSSPNNILSNNLTYSLYSGKLIYFVINNNRFYIKEFYCNQASLSVNKLGIITTTSGLFYNSDFCDCIFNNSNIQNSTLESCEINNSNIRNCQNISDCSINNNQLIQYSTLNQCSISNSSVQNCVLKKCNLKSGSIRKSHWYDGIFNDNQEIACYWYSDSCWYSGIWNIGYIDDVLSEQPPYIIANSKFYQDYTGQLSYIFQEQKYHFSVQNATFQISIIGNIIFQQGKWIDGTFANGNFFNGQFENGTFLNGDFQNSIWNNGTFENGTFYTSIWNDGSFNGGQFKNSIWNDGSFNGGQFKNSIWNDGSFNGGNWNTLGSFWFGGEWINGTQNNQLPTLNKFSITKFIFQKDIEQDIIQYIDQNQIQHQNIIDRIYKVNINSTDIKIKLLDGNKQQVNCPFISNLTQQISNEYGYYFKNDYLYIYFKEQIDNYFQLSISYDQQIFAPTAKNIQQFEEYLSDINNLITGQFYYTVQIQNQIKYYAISVKNANFTIANDGYITWNRGTFIDGTWYNGQWNALSKQLSDLVTENLQQMLLYTAPCVWENGIWMNGNWNYHKSIWNNGEWISGFVNNIQCNQSPNFQLGNGNSYNNYSGRIKYSITNDEIKKFYDCYIRNANIKFDDDGYILLLSGTWENGTWNNGQWYGDCWENGIWKDGIWKCGVWENGTWENGTWEINTKYFYNQGEYQQQKVQGCYRFVNKVLINKNNIPYFGFIILNNINEYSFSSNSNSSMIDLGEQIQFNSINSDGSLNSINSQYSEDLSNIIQVDSVIWVNSVWKDGFIKDIKSTYPPIYNQANNQKFYNESKNVVYKYKIFDTDGSFLYYQYFLLQFSSATLSVDQEGFITWYSGVLTGGIWQNGVWNGGIFTQSQWNNGKWYNGDFYLSLWKNGTWYNGNFNSKNSTWLNGQWKKGYIDNIYSEYSPSILTGNNKLFINYSGTIKYHYNYKYYMCVVDDASLVILEDGNIVFFYGNWKQGTWANGLWKTSQFNYDYNYIKMASNIIQLRERYSFGFLNYQFNDKNQFTLTDINNTSKLIKLFNDVESYNSVFQSGIFSNGTWKNGSWISGQWLTDKNNNPIATWINGIIDNIVQTEPPTYLIIGDQNLNVQFKNYTGRIKYKITPYDHIRQRVGQYYYSLLNVKNANFKIKYIFTKTKRNEQYYQTFIQWYNGQVLYGQWYNGIWHKGTWKNGTWRVGIWCDGIWENGSWMDGMWYNGFWNGGERSNIRIMNQVN